MIGGATTTTNNAVVLPKYHNSTETSGNEISADYHKMEDGVSNDVPSTVGPRANVECGTMQIEPGHQRTGSDEISSNGSFGDVSILSSVMTADELTDPTGFFVVCMVILIGDMSRGVMFPTLWPLIESLGGTEVNQGYAVAAFSFGRIIVSPMFGTWSVHHGYTNTLTFSCTILMCGCLMYAQIGNVGSILFLTMSQTMLGIGSGTLGVTRAFVAEVTPQRYRTTYMAWITAVQYCGFTVTPFVGASLAQYFGEGDDIKHQFQVGYFVLDAYTSPAYFMFIVCSITLILIRTYFRGRHREPKRPGSKNEVLKKSKRRTRIDEIANSKSMFFGMTVYDATILGCMLLNIAAKGSIGCFETIGVSYAQSYFDMESSQAGFAVGICGTFGVIALLSMGFIARYLTDIQMISYGLMVMAVGILSLSSIDKEFYEENEAYRFYLAISLVYSIGYPIGHTAIIGIFSKIVGRRPQGTMLGWFASAGSLARMIFPVMSGYIAHHQGMPTLFFILFGVLSAATLFTFMNTNILQKLSS